MKQQSRKWEYIGLTGTLLLAVLCLVLAVFRNSGIVQAELATPGVLSFVGEYSRDGESWLPITEGAELSALRGDLYLRGNFVEEIRPGMQLNFYRNHIGISIYVNGELWFISIVDELKLIGRELKPAVCGSMWEKTGSPGIKPEDEITVVLTNPHRTGNKTAYRDFLNTLCVTETGAYDLLEQNLLQYGKPFRLIGGLLAIASLLLLGAAAAAVILRISTAGVLFKTGFLCLFTGSYIAFDTIDVFFWSGMVGLNTYVRQLSMILAVCVMGLCIEKELTGKRKKVVRTAVLASALLDALLFLTSIVGVALIYDLMSIWYVVQVLLCPLLIVCCLLELCAEKKGKRLMLISGFVLPSTILIDLLGVGSPMMFRGACSKVAFLLLFLLHIVWAAKSVVTDHQASLRTHELERELEESRFDAAMSQIQPHFLYNALGSIYHLCGKDPERAQKAVSDFSDYLRVNLGSIRRKTPVPFETECRHVETYLELEKMSAGEELSYRFEIETTNFFLPALSIQPLVENAVKHGVLKKSGGGTVTVRTKEYPDRFEVTVEDDGVGFDPARPVTGEGTHIGIKNVRQRLQAMCGGTLIMDSVPGVGTLAVVRLPKREGTK